MSIFSQRSYGYKAGTCLLLVGTIIVITGFASPNWMECNATFEVYPQHEDINPFIHVQPYLPQVLRRHAHAGLWKGCMEQDTHTLCEVFTHVPSWLLGVRGLQCLALVGLLVSCSYALAVNWLIRSPPHNRLLEIVAAFSGIAGIAGVIVFMAETSKLDQNELFESSMGKGKEGEEGVKDVGSGFTVFCHVSWAFAITVCACVMTFLAAIVIAFNNLPLQVQVNPQPAPPSRRPANNHHPSQTLPQGTPPNAITIVPPQLGTNPTNLQVFYVPHANFTSATHPAMDFRPPAYEAHSPPPLPLSQPQMACPPAVGNLQPMPCSPGQQGPVVPEPAMAASAESALPLAPPSLPPEERKIVPQEPGV